MQCRSHAAQLGKLNDEFKAANYQILLILGDTEEKARRYVESLHLPFPVLSDPKRGVYQQYGLEKAFFLQRTASVIIDCNGIIRYIRSVTNPMPWLQESRLVLEQVKSLALTC
jgi:peroxiredoxin